MRNVLPLSALPQSSTSFSRVAWSILDCARCASTFLSCAFSEQGDHPAAPCPPPLPWRIVRSKRLMSAWRSQDRGRLQIASWTFVLPPIALSAIYEQWEMSA